VERWLTQGQAIAVATVIETWGSGPRRVGAKMALAANGEQAGSLSSGCAEPEVLSCARQVLQSGRAQLLNLKVSDPSAWDAGLPCGGTLEVWVERLDPPLLALLRAAQAEQRSIATVTILRGPDELVGRKLVVQEDGRVFGSLGRLDAAARARADQALGQARCLRLSLASEGDESAATEAFIDVWNPAPTLIAVGGIPIALALSSLAKALGYSTVVIDGGTAGAASRYPQVDRLLPRWPAAETPIDLTASTAVAVLTQNPELDEPVLLQALASRAFYVGALGSRASQARRRQRLIEGGLSEDQIARLHAPIGFDLGGRAPEEVALGVLAQIVAVRHQVSVPSPK
jgi:xanthine dehydrogenase accessory factor